MSMPASISPVATILVAISIGWILGIISFERIADWPGVMICIVGLLGTWLIGISLLSRNRRSMYPDNQD